MTKGKSSSDDRLIRSLRVVAAIVFMATAVLLVLPSVFNLPFINPGFRADPVIFGTMVAAVLLLLGVETADRLPGLLRTSSPKKTEEADEKPE